MTHRSTNSLSGSPFGNAHGGEYGLQGRTGEPGTLGGTPPDRNTRFVETSRGILSYAELAPLLGERVLVAVLAGSVDPGAYWRKLKERLKKEGNQTVTNCHGLKMTAADGKQRLTRRFFELYPQIRQSAVAESGATGGLPIRQSLITELATLEEGKSLIGESGKRLPSRLPRNPIARRRHPRFRSKHRYGHTYEQPPPL